MQALSSGDVYSVAPASLSEQPLAQGTAHGICVLPQAAPDPSLPPRPPTGDKGTERVGGVGVLPNSLPSACLWVLSKLK